MIGLAIEERTALLLQENRLRVFSKGHTHIFLKSADQRTIPWHELEPSDSAFVFFGPNGPSWNLTIGGAASRAGYPQKHSSSTNMEKPLHSVHSVLSMVRRNFNQEFSRTPQRSSLTVRE